MLNLDQFLSFNIFSYIKDRYKRSFCNIAPNDINYSEIAFILAQSEDLSQSIPLILSQTNSQQILQNLNGLITLLPGTGDKYAVHSANNIKSNRQYLSYLESLKINMNANPHQQFIQITKDYRFLFYPVKNEKLEWMAYLVLVFKGDIVDQAQVDFFSKRLNQAIQRGLQAYQKRHSEVANAINQERISQAADLHDSIAQVLSYLKLRSSSLISYLHEPDLETDITALKLANEIDNQIGFAHRLTRELIASSRLSFLQTNLSDAIKNSVEEFEQLSGVVFDLDNRAKEALECTTYQSEVLFIIRESMCNLVRHSHASHARIVITQRQGQLEILIEDNGIGIQLSIKRPDSFGLSIMEERARKINADLLIKKREEGGTCVKLTIPRDSSS